MEEFSEDLRDSPLHSSLRLLSLHLRHRLCFRRLAQHAGTLLHAFQEEGIHAYIHPHTHTYTHTHSHVFSLDIDRFTANRSNITDVSGEETGSVLSCSARDIAEELTRLDAVSVSVYQFSHECTLVRGSRQGQVGHFNPKNLSVILTRACSLQALFVRVVPFHCLGCVWSQRDKKENRSLAPSVRATITQFNSVTSLVITSLLCPPATPNSASSSLQSPRLHPGWHHTSPAHRACIIEKWVSVAQVCARVCVLV